MIGLALGAAGLLLLKTSPDKYDHKVAFLSSVGEVSVGMLLAAFLCFWWGLAAGVLTFQSPCGGAVQKGLLRGAEAPQWPATP